MFARGQSRSLHRMTQFMGQRACLSNASTWANINLAPPDKILGLTDAFKADKFDKKINLGVGAYRTDEGASYVLPSVKTAEERILSRNTDKE